MGGIRSVNTGVIVDTVLFVIWCVIYWDFLKPLHTCDSLIQVFSPTVLDQMVVGVPGL